MASGFDALPLDEDISFKAYDVTTSQDARAIVSEVFRPSVCNLLDFIEKNPVEGELNVSQWGDVAYRGDEAIGFQAAVHRKIYYQQMPYIAFVGSTFCLRRAESPVVAYELNKRTLKRSSEGVMSFGNTACKAAVRLLKASGTRYQKGPDSYDYRLWCCISWWRRTRAVGCHYLGAILRRLTGYVLCSKAYRKLPWKAFVLETKLGRIRRERTVDCARVEKFWQRYIVTNKGLVSSRSAAEIKWIYGDAIDVGKLVFLTMEDKEGVVGWIVLRPSEKSLGRWSIYDWIALDNNKDRLEQLLIGAKMFLKRCTPAWYFEAHGFPDGVQPMLRRQLPNRIWKPGDVFVCSFWNEEFKQKVKSLDYPDSWFFGIYDGDAAWQWHCEM